MATRAGSNTVGDLEEAKLLQAEDQFIFLQNTTNKTKRISRKNFFNTPGLIVKGKFISPEGNDVGFTAATALANAATAQATAQGAQTSANGKAKVYYQNDEPTGGTYNAGDLWYDTNDNYKLYVRTGGAWVESFAPMLKLDANNNVAGLQKVGGVDKAFVLVADYFQIWNGASADVPFEVVPDPANPPNQVVRIKNAQIQTVDAGKLTAGFISSQVIEVANSTAYIQSNNFILTWVEGMVCKAYNNALPYKGKVIPSDNIRCKVLQSDGSFKVFNCLVNHTSSAGNAPPASGSNTWWQEISTPTRSVTIAQGDPAVNIDDMGFRIVGNGQAEFSGVLTRGAVIAKEGFFGTTKNAARIDTNGLTIGNYGRIKSASIGYSGTDFTSSGNSGGFFLGNTQAEGQAELYQFFIGNPSANFLRWNGTDLIINGKVGIPSTGNVDTDAGLEITSGFGIRRTSKDKVLTITGGNGNGITYGAQIDLCGTEFMGSSGLAEGQLILSAGYDSTLASPDPSRDGCIIFRTSRESNANIGVQRLRIDLDGTVRVVDAGNANAGAPDDGAGKLVVENEIKVGADITLTASTGEIEAVSYNSTSSKRFKKKIKNLKGGLDIINSLRPVTFDWKKKEKKNDIGLIAEEVNEILPMIVGKDENNLASSIDYSKLTPILIQAVKELSLEVERLKNKINHASARD